MNHLSKLAQPSRLAHSPAQLHHTKWKISTKLPLRQICEVDRFANKGSQICEEEDLRSTNNEDMLRIGVLLLKVWSFCTKFESFIALSLYSWFPSCLRIFFERILFLRLSLYFLFFTFFSLLKIVKTDRHPPHPLQTDGDGLHLILVGFGFFGPKPTVVHPYFL